MNKVIKHSNIIEIIIDNWDILEIIEIKTPNFNFNSNDHAADWVMYITQKQHFLSGHIGRARIKLINTKNTRSVVKIISNFYVKLTSIEDVINMFQTNNYQILHDQKLFLNVKSNNFLKNYSIEELLKEVNSRLLENIGDYRGSKKTEEVIEYDNVVSLIDQVKRKEFDELKYDMMLTG